MAMAVVLVDQWKSIHGYEFQLRSNLLAIALSSMMVLFFLDAYGWHLILKSLGLHPDVRHSVHIWMLSSVARYLPGGVWGYISRASLSVDSGVSLGQASLALYFETLLLLVSSLTVGLPALWAASGLPFAPEYAIVLTLAIALLLHPRIVALLRHLPGRAGRAFFELSIPSAGRTLILYAYYILFWVLFGASFVVFVSAFEPLPTAIWIAVGSSIALGFSAGFALVFVPSGIGVRESVIYVLLLPVLPTTTCLVVSLGSRFWIMTSEALSVGLTEVAFRFWKPSL